MDLATLINILNMQVTQLNSQILSLINLADEAQQVISEENAILGINPRIKAIMASANIMMSAAGSQTVIVQGVIDDISNIVN